MSIAWLKEQTMKKRLLLWSVCFGLSTAAVANTRTVTAVRAAGPIVLDGKFSEPEWQQARW